jgi:hypothetical protein
MLCRSPQSYRALHAGTDGLDPPSVVEGQIAELCRDLSVEAKRMRQLQQQADELRRVIRQWTNPKLTRTATALIVEDDAEQ